MIILVKGSDPRLIFTLQQKDNFGEVRPVPITNSMVIAVTYRDLIGLKTKTTASGVSILNAPFGKILVSFTDIETNKFKLGTMDVDISLTEGEETMVWQFIGDITAQSRV
jgi:hypothetical protein